MDDLDNLIAKLDEGRDREAVELVWPVFGDRTPTGLILASIAKPSSVDMALRLHEALLPGWEWHLGPSNAKVYPYNGHPGESWGGMSDKPARAWLIAILRAVKAQQSPGGGA